MEILSNLILQNTDILSAVSQIVKSDDANCTDVEKNTFDNLLSGIRELNELATSRETKVKADVKDSANIKNVSKEQKTSKKEVKNPDLHENKPSKSVSKSENRNEKNENNISNYVDNNAGKSAVQDTVQDAVQDTVKDTYKVNKEEVSEQKTESLDKKVLETNSTSILQEMQTQIIDFDLLNDADAQELNITETFEKPSSEIVATVENQVSDVISSENVSEYQIQNDSEEIVELSGHNVDLEQKTLSDLLKDDVRPIKNTSEVDNKVAVNELETEVCSANVSNAEKDDSSADVLKMTANDKDYNATNMTSENAEVYELESSSAMKIDVNEDDKSVEPDLKNKTLKVAVASDVKEIGTPVAKITETVKTVLDKVEKIEIKNNLQTDFDADNETRTNEIQAETSVATLQEDLTETFLKVQISSEAETEPVTKVMTKKTIPLKEEMTTEDKEESTEDFVLENMENADDFETDLNFSQNNASFTQGGSFSNESPSTQKGLEGVAQLQKSFDGVKNIVRSTSQNILKSDVLNQLTEKFSQFKDGTTTRLNVVLNPENLGKIGVELVSRPNGVSARILADTQQVKELLDKNIDTLKNSLVSQGVNVNNIVVKAVEAAQGSELNFAQNFDFTNNENAQKQSTAKTDLNEDFNRRQTENGEDEEETLTNNLEEDGNSVERKEAQRLYSLHSGQIDLVV